MNSDNQQLIPATHEEERIQPPVSETTYAADAGSLPPVPLPVSPLLLPFRSSAFSTGLLSLAISGTLFLLHDYLTNDRPTADLNLIMVMVHYGIAVLFSAFLLTNGHLKFRQPTYADERPARWLGLLLWLISAYALNREMAVFQQSTTWLYVALILIGMAMTAYGWKETLPVRIQQVLYAVLAAGCLLFGYMAVYVAGLYPVSVPMLIGLGLSIHTFVPLAFAVTLGKRLWHDSRREEHLRPGIRLGLVVPLIVTTVFLVGWYRTLHCIERVQMAAVARRTSDLPDWVLMAQQLKPGWITNRLLLNRQVYDDGFFFDGPGWGLGSLTAHDDRRQHDPLVVVAMRLFPPDALPEHDQRRLLNVLADERHGTEEKFWTGRHLTTEQVVTQVRIWPAFRLSYTEKILSIRNEARSTTEEALYTFQLPAGSAVSGMALWVNGLEEPARLTTVAKADSAYRTIVGVESRLVARDPSVVYWQEGNRVTLRVFPCRAGEDRRVKLGITSPLRLEGQRLVYQNPSFEGPDPSSADELTTVTFATPPGDLKMPWIDVKQTGNELTHEGRYAPHWTLQLTAPSLSAAPFVLDGRAYRLAPYRPVLSPFVPSDVYLDVNAAWTVEEYRAALRTAQLNHCHAWVFDDGLTAVTPQNSDALYEHLSSQPFSLFPLYRLHDPATALIITKGTATSPTLRDLDGSPFARHFGIVSRQSVPVRTFCFGALLSPYLRTLADLRVLNLTHGSADDLLHQLTVAHQFARPADDSTQIRLPEAGVVIRNQAVPKASAELGPEHQSTPDHLARLFIYNHLLRQIGRTYFDGTYKTDRLIRTAQQAHVVSPLSSLVVLETAADYDRFHITSDTSGLDNATLKQDGAVPEPHEWALLLLVSALVGWLFWRKRYGLA